MRDQFTGEALVLMQVGSFMTFHSIVGSCSIACSSTQLQKSTLRIDAPVYDAHSHQALVIRRPHESNLLTDAALYD